MIDQPTNARPNWNQYFLGIAEVVSRRADCSRAQYGVVIVSAARGDGMGRRLIGAGYNGSPPGGPSCLAGECPRATSNVEHNHSGYSTCIALHAEQNAIARVNGDMVGATIYIWGGRPPCDMCSKLIKAAGIENVVWE